MTPTPTKRPAVPDDIDDLREWAQLGADAGANEWRLVCQLLAAYDRRGERLKELTAARCGICSDPRCDNPNGTVSVAWSRPKSIPAPIAAPTPNHSGIPA